MRIIDRVRSGEPISFVRNEEELAERIHTEAIEECIAAVEGVQWTFDGGWYGYRQDVLAALRALLEREGER